MSIQNIMDQLAAKDQRIQQLEEQLRTQAPHALVEKLRCADEYIKQLEANQLPKGYIAVTPDLGQKAKALMCSHYTVGGISLGWNTLKQIYGECIENTKFIPPQKEQANG